MLVNLMFYCTVDKSQDLLNDMAVGSSDFIQRKLFRLLPLWN